MIGNFLTMLATNYLNRRGMEVRRRAGLGMTLSGNAIAIKHQDGSYTVHLAKGSDNVDLRFGSQLIIDAPPQETTT